MIRAQAIQLYDTDFRSTLEATYAAFFTHCNLRWVYEPFRYGLWLPDFWVSDFTDHFGLHGLFVEVKPDVETAVEEGLQKAGYAVAAWVTRGDLLSAPYGYALSALTESGIEEITDLALLPIAYYTGPLEFEDVWRQAIDSVRRDGVRIDAPQKPGYRSLPDIPYPHWEPGMVCVICTDHRQLPPPSPRVSVCPACHQVLMEHSGLPYRGYGTCGECGREPLFGPLAVYGAREHLKEMENTTTGYWQRHPYSEIAGRCCSCYRMAQKEKRV